MDVIVVAIVVGLVVFGFVVVGGIVVVIVGHRNLNLKFGQNHVIISDVLLLFLSLLPSSASTSTKSLVIFS